MKIVLDENQQFESAQLIINIESLDDLLILMHIGNMSVNQLRDIIQADTHITLKPMVINEDFQALYNHLHNMLYNRKINQVCTL